MSMIVTRHGSEIGLEGGGLPCCLICLGKRAPPQGGGGVGGTRTPPQRKPGDIFLKVCNLLSVSYNEIQQEWDFGGSSGGSNEEKLPFCGNCFEAVKAVIGLQEEVEALEKKIKAGTEYIREKIRQSSSVGNCPLSGTDFHRVRNFQSKVLARSGEQYQGSVIVSNSLSGPTQLAMGGVWTLPQAPPQQQQQSPYIAQATSSSNQLNYLSHQPPQPPVVVVESPGALSFTVTPGFRLTTAVIEGQQSVSVSPTSAAFSQDDFKNEYFEENDDNVDGYSEGVEQTEEDEVIITPPKRSKSSNTKTRKSQQSPSLKSSQKRENEGSRRSEYFAPVETDPNGKMLFEGILIIPNESGKGYTCGLCSAVCGKAHDSISLRKIKIHIKGFHLGAYKCQICSKNFTSNDILNQHVTRSHKVGDQPCDICLKPIRPRYMLLHKYTHMNAEEKAALVATGFKPPISSFDKEKKYPCPKCGAMFKKMTNLRIHERTHMDTKTRPMHNCDHCEKSYTNSQSLKEHVHRVHLDRLTVKAELRRRELCKVCGKTVFARIMARHLKTHVATEDRPFACKVCAKRFQDEKVLKRHQEKFHKEGDTPDLLPFACDICGKRSATKLQVRAHRRRVHKDNWKAKIPSNLRGDVTVDDPSGDFMLLEDLNNEGLQHVQKNVYSYHLYQVEKIQEDSPNQLGFKCCTCSKLFMEGKEEEEELEEKVKTHIRQEHIGNYRCNLCTKRMKNLAEAIAHNRTEHMHMDSFDCTICGKPGIPRKSIKGHQFSHKNIHEAADAINQGILMPGRGNVNQGDKRLEEMEEILRGLGEKLCFTCGVCPADFDTLGKLDEHRRKKHLEKSTRVRLETTNKSSVCIKDKGSKSRRGRKKKESKNASASQRRRTRGRGAVREGSDVLPEALVKVEMPSEEESAEGSEIGQSDCDEGSSNVEMESDQWNEESDPDFNFSAKTDVAKSPRVSLRGRRLKRNVNYVEAPEEEEDSVIPRKKNGRGKKQSSSVTVKTEAKEEMEMDQVSGDDKDYSLQGEKYIKQSPDISDDEGRCVT